MKMGGKKEDYYMKEISYYFSLPESIIQSIKRHKKEFDTLKLGKVWD